MRHIIIPSRVYLYVLKHVWRGSFNLFVKNIMRKKMKETLDLKYENEVKVLIYSYSCANQLKLINLSWNNKQVAWYDYWWWICTSSVCMTKKRWRILYQTSSTCSIDIWEGHWDVIFTYCSYNLWLYHILC